MREPRKFFHLGDVKFDLEGRNDALLHHQHQGRDFSTDKLC